MRPTLAAVLVNRVAALGVALTTASAVLFLSLLALDLFGVFQNPYVGLVVFVALPALFLLGLVLIPIGIRLERRRQAAAGAETTVRRFNLSDPGVRRMVGFVSIATVVNLIIVSVASFGAVEYTESQAFCGQVCHTPMEPEFVAHQNGPHGRVHCVSCHVGPGTAGFLTAKLNGTRQLALVVSGRYHRPIPVPVVGLPAASATCEQCHSPDRYVGDVLKIFYEHADDEANTATVTNVRLHVGGPVSGTGSGTGIHWHMNRGNVIDYAVADGAREKIPYVRVQTADGALREYFADGVTPADVERLPRRRMDCRDCHSRPAHTFAASPERIVDAALGAGLISTKIPFIRREAVRALRAEYPSQAVAAPQIAQTIRAAMAALPPVTIAEADLARAIGVTQALYRHNIFPTMKVGWGTYPNQLGHTVSTGCFRCHDDSHKTRDGVPIRQDCEMCHAIE